MLRTPSLAGARAFERMLTTPLPPHARTPRPQVDSFWQAQAVLMLTPRMPLYIPCVYNAFLYWSNVAAAHAFAGRDADARAAADAAASAAARSPREHTGEFEDLDAVAKQLAFEFDAAESDLADAIEAVSREGAASSPTAVSERASCAPCRWAKSEAVAEASLAALLGAVLYAPYDVCGARFLWWTWHLDDAGVKRRWATHGDGEGGVPAGSTAWTLIFGFWFSYLLRVAANKRWSFGASLGFVAALATPSMMATMTPLCAVALDRLAEPSASTLLLTIALLGAAVATKLRRSGATRAARRAPAPVAPALVAFFFVLGALAATARPEAQVSHGVHQMWGPCEASDVDMVGYARAEFVCADPDPLRARAAHAPSEYLSYECAAAVAAARARSGVALPAAVRPADALDAAKQWYTVCGVADDAAGATKAVAVAWVGALGALGAAAYAWALAPRAAAAAEKEE